MRRLRLTTIVALLIAPCSTQLSAQQPQSLRPALAIHGGAGRIVRENTPPAAEAAIRAALEHALVTGYSLLQRGGSAVDAVEAAIRILEDSPCFNAGKGAVRTAAGTFELDASIMDGGTHAAGAVAAVTRVKNPITLARRVMTNTPHVMLIGEGAESFAREERLDTVPNSHFAVEPGACRADSVGSLRKKPMEVPSAEWSSHKYGTVGAVALDQAGHLAAGTSTGGLSRKRSGRVGDSPIIGAGTYASDRSGCAVSATGWGEYFIRYTVAADICKRVEYLQEPIDQAAKHTIHTTLQAAGATGGVIVMDSTGRSARVFNTDGMFRGYIDADGKPVIELFR